LKIASQFSSATLVAVLGAAFAVVSVVRAQEPAQPPAGGPPPHEHEHADPAPTNLKVLPKTMTGEQVHEVMHKWEAQLGSECTTCHAADPSHVGPNGRPRLNFADDSKPEKATARLMYRMVEDINTQYIGKIDSSGSPVSCGTCHRGHLDPPPFVAPPGHEPEHHDAGPPPGTNPPAAR
jgi:hypothetical protein